MNVADFEDLLDRLGEDMAGWPATQQQAAAALLRTSAEARGLLQQARLLREKLSAPPIRAAPAFADRIMQGIGQQAPTVSVAVIAQAAGPSLRWWQIGMPSRITPLSPGLILAVCFLIGIFSGLFPSLSPEASSQADFPGFLAYVMDISRATAY